MATDRTDHELLRAWKSGDARAGQELFRRHDVSITRFFQTMVNDDASQDLTQQTFLGLIEGIDQFREDCSFRTYLFTIAHRRLYDHFRQNTRDGERFEPYETTLQGLRTSPSQALEINERDTLLLQAMRQLPVIKAIVLELYYWEQLKVREIAVALELPKGTVKTHLVRGRAQLEKILSEGSISKDQFTTAQGGLQKWEQQSRADPDFDDSNQ